MMGALKATSFDDDYEFEVPRPKPRAKRETIQCLKCNCKFKTADKKLNRICATCKKQQSWKYLSE